MIVKNTFVLIFERFKQLINVCVQKFKSRKYQHAREPPPQIIFVRGRYKFMLEKKYVQIYLEIIVFATNTVDFKF